MLNRVLLPFNFFKIGNSCKFYRTVLLSLSFQSWPATLPISFLSSKLNNTASSELAVRSQNSKQDGRKRATILPPSPFAGRNCFSLVGRGEEARKKGGSDDIGASCLEERARAWKRNCEGWHRERVEKGKRWTRTRNSLLHSDEDKPCGSLHLVYFVEWFAGIWYTLPSPSFSSSLPPSHLSARLVNVRPFVSTPFPLPMFPVIAFISPLALRMIRWNM